MYGTHRTNLTANSFNVPMKNRNSMNAVDLLPIRRESTTNKDENIFGKICAAK